MAKVEQIDRSSLGGELYPVNEDEHAKLVARMDAWFIAAHAAREPHEKQWKKYYRLYRSYVERRKGDWKSRAFVAVVFWVVETIIPRLVAQLPRFLVNPVSEDDVETADAMERLLEWAAKRSKLFIHLVDATKSSLIYGTGILKTYQRMDVRTKRVKVPVMKDVTETVTEPQLDPTTGEPAVDMDGAPITESREVVVGQVEAGYKWEKRSYVAYDGPAAINVDIFNFFPAPEAQDIQEARYVIHRSFTDWDDIKRRVDEGIYKLPEWMDEEDIYSTSDEPASARLTEIGYGPTNNDPTRKTVEVLEAWTRDGKVLTVANRSIVLRYAPNPFDHGEKPFVRLVDQKVPNEFWGIGEVEPIEGQQDLLNATVNQRQDAVRLLLNPTFAVNENRLADLRDLVMRPGGVIRTKGQDLPQEVLHRVDLGDVNSSAYKEAAEIQTSIERTSGVNSYQAGMDQPAMNDTATGVKTLTENGATRFALKSRLAELMGLEAIAYHFGSNIQQFTSEEKVIRILGPKGKWVWETFDPEALQGALDYEIEAGSELQTEASRRQEALTLLQTLPSFLPVDPMTGLPGPGVKELVINVLRSFGFKDFTRFFPPEPEWSDELQTFVDENGQPIPMPPMDPMAMGGADPSMGQPALPGMDPGMGGIDEVGGRQAYGQPLPPGAIPVGQSAAFGPARPGSQMQMLQRLIAERANRGPEEVVGA